MDPSALIVGVVAGIATGLLVKNRSRKVRIGTTVVIAYVALIVAVLTIAVIRMNSG